MCLTRELDQRFETAGELAAELGRFERGEPILSRRIGVLDRTWRWAKRNPAVAGLLSVVFITLASGIAFSTYFGLSAQRAEASRVQVSIDRLATAESNLLESILEDEVKLAFESSNGNSMLERIRDARGAANLSEADRLRYSIACLRLEPNGGVRQQFFSKKTIENTVESLLRSDGYEMQSFCRSFNDQEKELVSEQLGQKITVISDEISSDEASERLFKIACALARVSPDSKYWKETAIAKDLAGYVTSMNLIDVQQWLPTIAMVGDVAVSYTHLTLPTKRIV